MAKRVATRTLSDAYSKSRKKSAKPARVSFIRGGVKYRPGHDPVQVCPHKTMPRAGGIAAPVGLVKPAAPVVAAAPAPAPK